MNVYRWITGNISKVPGQVHRDIVGYPLGWLPLSSKKVTPYCSPLPPTAGIDIQANMHAIAFHLHKIFKNVNSSLVIESQSVVAWSRREESGWDLQGRGETLGAMET